MDFNLASNGEILHQLGARLRAQRLAQGLPQAELAAMAGVSLGTVKSLERGAASSLETFIRIVQALGLSDHLQPLFLLPRQSIAQMEQAQSAQRLRAPRRKTAASGANTGVASANTGASSTIPNASSTGKTTGKVAAEADAEPEKIDRTRA